MFKYKKPSLTVSVNAAEVRHTHTMLKHACQNQLCVLMQPEQVET